MLQVNIKDLLAWLKETQFNYRLLQVKVNYSKSVWLDQLVIRCKPSLGLIPGADNLDFGFHHSGVGKIWSS